MTEFSFPSSEAETATSAVHAIVAAPIRADDGTSGQGNSTMPINAHILPSKSGLFSVWLENMLGDDQPGTVNVFVPGYLNENRARMAAEKFALAIGRVARWV